MGGLVKYCDRTVYYNLMVGISTTDTHTYYQLQFDSLGDLELLLSMKDHERISIDSNQMSISEFRREVLNHTHKIYTEEAHVADLGKNMLVYDQNPKFNEKGSAQLVDATFSDPKIRSVIGYHGKEIAICNVVPNLRSKDIEYEFIFDKLKDLESLIFIKPNEQINYNDQSLSNSEFKERIFRQCHRMYIAPDKIPSCIAKDHAIDIEFVKIRCVYGVLRQMFKQ